jgi:hypothetical protein
MRAENDVNGCVASEETRWTNPINVPVRSIFLIRVVQVMLHGL